MAEVKKARARLSRKFIFAGVNALSGVVLCALVLVFTLGEPVFAFIWATNSASTSGDVIIAADVNLELIDVAEKQIKNFLSADAATKAQVELLSNIGSSATQEATDGYFAEWCLSNLLEGDKGYLESAEAACQYSILQRSYTFKNESRMPVYFRINRASVTNGMDIALAALWNRGGSTPYNSFCYDAESDCYYYKEPLFAGQEIMVAFAALILDTSEIGGGNFDFRPDFAEIIQSTNNAVFMVEGWANVAEQLTPYITSQPANDGGNLSGLVGDAKDLEEVSIDIIEEDIVEEDTVDYMKEISVIE